jgi:CYTH domain-containing protein
MGIEIERKFLVRNELWCSYNVVSSTFFEQGYLSKDPERTVRVRFADPGGFTPRAPGAFLTIKGLAPEDNPLCTPEFEYPIPVEEAKELLGMCLPGKIEKVRLCISYEGFSWELDIFGGENAGLVLAEIELLNPSETFPEPPWLGEEVTHDVRYRNSYLSSNPFKTWNTQ